MATPFFLPMPPITKPRLVGTRSSSRKIGPSTVLLAVSGLTPAILTETVWALAHENPPTIPQQIIVLTTEAGRIKIAEQLFGPDQIWLQLRAALLGTKHAQDLRLDFDCTPDRVKVFHRRQGANRIPINELSSLADNQAIADALVDELWQHTSKPDTRVIASLAGGYKTMSALCLSAMQLLANPGDRVTHVLAGGGFDQTKPPFYFPTQIKQRLTGPCGTLRAREAAKKIQLIDVPVVLLRRWFEDLLHTKPPSYAVLLSQGSAALQSTQAADLRLELGPLVLPPESKSKHYVLLNNTRHPLSPDQYAYLRFFAERVCARQPTLERAVDAVEELAGWLLLARKNEPRFFRMSEAFETANFTADSFAKRMSDLRAFFKKSPGPCARLAALLPSKGHWALHLPANSITLR